MNFCGLSDACESVILEKNEENISNLFDKIEEIPKLFAESKDSFLTKILELKKANLQTAITSVCSIRVIPQIQLKLIKFIDFLIATSSKKEELNEIFSNGFINTIITYKFDIIQNDILLSYSTLLKSIAMKVESVDSSCLFTEFPITFPLYYQANNLISYSDSIAVSSARFVLLRLCTSKDEKIIDFINFHIPRGSIQRIVDSDDIEDTDFIADLISVSPQRFSRFIKSCYKNKLRSIGNDPRRMIEELQNFSSTPLKDTIIKVVNEKLVSYDYNNVLCLGILLECLTQKLVLFDTGLALGFIPPSAVSNMKGLKKNYKKDNTVCDIINKIANMQENVITLNLCLNIWKKAYPTPPPMLFSIQLHIAQLIRKTLCNDHILAFVERTEKLPRTDLSFIKSLDTLEKEDIMQPSVQVSHLTAIQLCLGQWTNTPFNTIAFPDIKLPDRDEIFLSLNGENLDIGVDSLIVNDEKHHLMKIFTQLIKSKKTVEITFFDSSKCKFGQRGTETREIEFASIDSAEMFNDTVKKHQMYVIDVMLQGIGG